MKRKDKSNNHPNVKLKHNGHDWFKEFQEKYGHYDYYINYEQFPRDGISNINNFWIKKTICAIPSQLNRIIKRNKDEEEQLKKEELKEVLENILDPDEKDQLEDKELQLLHALANENSKDAWRCLRQKKIDFSMTDADKEKIYEFVRDQILEIVENLDRMIQEERKEDSFQERFSSNPRGKNIGVKWADRVSEETKERTQD